MLRFAREKFKIFIRLDLKFYKDQWSKYMLQPKFIFELWLDKQMVVQMVE